MNIGKLIDTVKFNANLRYDNEFAALLGIKTSSLSTMRSRNTITLNQLKKLSKKTGEKASVILSYAESDDND